MTVTKGNTLVTGANGFVGRALCARLRNEGHALRALSKRPAPDCLVGPELDQATQADWRPLVEGCSTVVHCAARVHRLQDDARDPLAAYLQTNTAATLELAQAAIAAGVKRFIFLSTIKVHGEQTLPGQPFSAASALAPEDAYAQSKAEAERALQTLAAESKLEVVIIRPPLVYGPGVKANFARLVAALERGLPLPLATFTHNRRSLLALDNLVDLISLCRHHPAAANRAFLACDGEDLSTAGLVTALAAALGLRPRLFPLPAPLLSALAGLLGQRATLARLRGSLQVDMSATTEILGWQPPLSVAAGLQRCLAAEPQ